MNLKRCDKGHFYDVDKYDSCPHCAEADMAGDDMTATVRYQGSSEQQGVTISETMAINPAASMDFVTIGSTEPASKPTVAATGGLGELMGEMGDLSSVYADTVAADEDDNVTKRYNPANAMNEPVVGWLVCISGNNTGLSYNLKTGRNFIGRSKSMDVVLDGDMSISRDRHAIILYEPRKREFLVQPGESRELFYVNDEVILNTQKLNPYDKLLIGETELYFIPFCGERFAWEDIAKSDEE